MDKEKIYPINFTQSIEFVVGPKLKVSGLTPCLIPTDKIVGFDMIQPCEEFKPIDFYPHPIALESQGLYTLIPAENYWKPDLVGISATHIYCLLLPAKLAETTRQTILSVVNHIHGNRTLLERNEVYEQVYNNKHLNERIKAAYGIDNDIIKHLSDLLIHNGYAKAPQKRKSQKNRQKSGLLPVNRDTKEQPNTPEDDIHLKNKWDVFAKNTHGVLLFDEIINTFPDNKRQQTKSRLYQLILSEESLEDVWKKVSIGLGKQSHVKAAS
ncbi:MAG: hypothetical protein R8K50_03215 [Mariprofundus sp.]